MEQLGIDGIMTRLLHRRDDPETSREAAAKVVPHLKESAEEALWFIRIYGPGTMRQIADAALADRTVLDATALYHRLSRRLGDLARDGLIYYQRDARGMAVKVDGARVWEATT